MVTTDFPEDRFQVGKRLVILGNTPVEVTINKLAPTRDGAAEV